MENWFKLNMNQIQIKGVSDMTFYKLKDETFAVVNDYFDLYIINNHVL